MKTLHFISLNSCFFTVEVNSMMNPVFYSNFSATNANLIFLGKIDKDLKSVIENIFFFQFLCDFKNRCHRMEISTLYQFLFFNIPICT